MKTWKHCSLWGNFQSWNSALLISHDHSSDLPCSVLYRLNRVIEILGQSWKLSHHCSSSSGPEQWLCSYLVNICLVSQGMLQVDSAQTQSLPRATLVPRRIRYSAWPLSGTLLNSCLHFASCSLKILEKAVACFSCVSQLPNCRIVPYYHILTMVYLTFSVTLITAKINCRTKMFVFRWLSVKMDHGLAPSS